MCPRFLLDELDPLLAVPIVTSGASSSDLRLDLDRVVVLFAYTAHDSPVPFAPVPPLRKDGRAAFEFNVLRVAYRCARQIRVDNKLSDVVACPPKRDVPQYLMEKVELLLPICIFENSSVLPEYAKVEALDNG